MTTLGDLGSELATVGLWVSGFGYRMFVSVVSEVSCMDYGFGAWIQCTSMAIAKRGQKQCPMKSV